MPDTPEPPPAASLLHRAALPVCLVFAGLTLAASLRVPVLENARWPGALFLLTALTATLLALARNLPLQNVLMSAALIAAISGFANLLNAKTGLPFGARVCTDAAGPQLLLVPWPVPLIWVVAILNSRGVARLILRPWRRNPRYGFHVIGLTCALTVIFDLSFEPWAGAANDWWYWQMPPTVPMWCGTPWVNFLGWTVTTLLILAFVTPWLINKKPGPPPPLDYQPLILWLLLNLLPAAPACGAAHHLWSATAVSLLAAALVTVLALRGTLSASPR